MSASMHWRPVYPKPEGEYVEDEVRRALARRLWNHDGSLVSDPSQLDKDDLPYLEGLRDGLSGDGATSAQDLIDAIRKHGSVEIWISR